MHSHHWIYTYVEHLSPLFYALANKNNIYESFSRARTNTHVKIGLRTTKRKKNEQKKSHGTVTARWCSRETSWPRKVKYSKLIFAQEVKKKRLHNAPSFFRSLSAYEMIIALNIKFDTIIIIIITAYLFYIPHIIYESIAIGRSIDADSTHSTQQRQHLVRLVRPYALFPFRIRLCCCYGRIKREYKVRKIMIAHLYKLIYNHKLSAISLSLSG